MAALKKGSSPKTSVAAPANGGRAKAKSPNKSGAADMTKKASGSEDDDSRFQPKAPSKSRFQGLPIYARLVLDVVDTIPRGRVMAYGDIAEYLEQGGPRLVARMMALYGSEVPWHRVLRADGTCASEVADRQYPLLLAEGVPFTKGGRVAIEAARWIPHVPQPRRSQPSSRSNPTSSVPEARRVPRAVVAESQSTLTFRDQLWRLATSFDEPVRELWRSTTSFGVS